MRKLNFLIVLLLGLSLIAAVATKLTDLTLTGDLIVGDDATVTGDMTVSGTFTPAVTSAVDFSVTDDLFVEDDADIDGILSVTGTVTATGIVTAEHLDSSDDLVVDDDGLITGTLTVTEAIVSTGNITANGNITGDGASVLSGIVANVITATTDTVLTAAQSGSIVTNLGAGGTIVITIPAAATGLYYGFHVLEAQVMNIDPAAADLIQGTNADGDKYGADAAGEILWLYCRGASSTPNWISMGKEGTWTDGN